ncbi:hypothetical protein A0J61_08928, partial [Choanephora cucurbitarum]
MFVLDLKSDKTCVLIRMNHYITRTSHQDKERDTGDMGFVQKWVDFLADAEKNRSFHRYSPERNGVVRLGNHVLFRNDDMKDMYKRLTSQLMPSSSPDFCSDLKRYLSEIMNS